MASYIVDLHRLDPVAGTFDKIDEITTYVGLQYSNKLNGIGSSRFELAVQDLKATRSNFVRFSNHVAIRRNGAKNPIWFGPITNLALNYRNVEGRLSVECNTYLYHLTTRFSEFNEIFEEQNIAQIAVDLINDVQSRENGNLAINVPSPVPTSIDRERTLQYKQISRELIELSNLIGAFDFSFDAQNDTDANITGIDLNIYPSRLGRLRNDLPPLQLYKGDESNNIRSIRLKNTAEIINNSIVQGAGTSTDNAPIISEQSFGASQRAYTRRETVQALKAAQLSNTLSVFNTAYLNRFSVEQFRVDVELFEDKLPSLSQINLGDTLILNSNIGNADGYLAFDGKRGRVEEILVTVDSEGTEYVTPRLQMFD